jgi:hypothetical protein
MHGPYLNDMALQYTGRCYLGMLPAGCRYPRARSCRRARRQEALAVATTLAAHTAQCHSSSVYGNITQPNAMHMPHLWTCGYLTSLHPLPACCISTTTHSANDTHVCARALAWPVRAHAPEQVAHAASRIVSALAVPLRRTTETPHTSQCQCQASLHPLKIA